MKKLRRQQKDLQSPGKRAETIKLATYVPHSLNYTTTNGKNFKDFRYVENMSPERAKKCAPKQMPVTTVSLPGHF